MSAVSSSEMDAINVALNATFSALADPTRRAMLARLSQGEASVNELAAPFKMSLPAVSKHIKVLEKAGLLTKTVNAQQRPCKIDGVQLKQAVDWIDQYTTKNIANKLINKPAIAQNNAKNQFKPEKMPQKSKEISQAKDANNDNAPNDIQQQIGFDF